MAANGALRFLITASVPIEGRQGESPRKFRRHLASLLPSSVVLSIFIGNKGNSKKHHAAITVLASKRKANSYCKILRENPYEEQVIHAQCELLTEEPTAQEEEEGVQAPSSKDVDDDAAEAKAAASWKDAGAMAERFFAWLHTSSTQPILEELGANLASIDRDKVARLFQRFQQGTNRRTESLVMSALRQKRRLRSQRYSDGLVICVFAQTDGLFPTLPERLTAREKLRAKRIELTANKGGVFVPANPDVTPMNSTVPLNEKVSVVFPIRNTLEGTNEKIRLVSLRLAGSHKSSYKEDILLPLEFPPGQERPLRMQFRAKGMGVYRANAILEFEDSNLRRFNILRPICLRAGDSDMYEVLKPTKAYAKKKQKPERVVTEKDIVHAPRLQAGKRSGFLSLKQYKIPMDTRNLTEKKEIEETLEPPRLGMGIKAFGSSYQDFWNQLLWIAELQAYEDIKLYDMEDVSLSRMGKFFKLFVAGLYEGRPSVLKGDLVLCTWKGKQYRARVVTTEALEAVLEFDRSFHNSFHPDVDRIEKVRFTFTRTIFRTSHKGVFGAPDSLRQALLMPEAKHVQAIVNASKITGFQHRQLPATFKFTSQNLNDEQKSAVRRIAEAKLRPMPYVIFGPPGTGKTTTLVESVYQLARLHTYTKGASALKILLVAPSNDATDILVERLSVHFPPSEMLRVLAHTRSMEHLPQAVKSYVREGLDNKGLLSLVQSSQIRIVVSTVNMAARIWCLGGDPAFDVLMVDEAGHATEPEIVGVAAMMKYYKFKTPPQSNPKQLVLAGDPKQLGPIITSEVCKRFGMGVSYMERLVTTSPAYEKNEENSYPPDLVTLLVNNYRSHPKILELPNQMFYDNKLKACGDRFTTHSMCKWEHLPTDNSNGFPIVFHAIEGENLREASSPSWFNPQEAIQVVEYVQLLTKLSRPPIQEEDIGIITPYQRQVAKIRTALKAKGMNQTDAIKVGSVETFQGQERRVVIISTVRAENNLLEQDKKYNLGFVANEKRFNVAVSRAKALLIVVGNPYVLATDQKNWRPFLKFCKDNGSWLGDDWDETVASNGGDDGFDVDMVSSEDSDNDGEDDWHHVHETEATGYLNREE